VKIKFTSGPKTGTIEHLQPSIANVLIASGMAEAVPLPVRGSADWLKERMEQSARVTKPHPEDVVVQNVIGVVWENFTLPRSGQPAILRKSGSETVRFTEDEFLGDPSCGIRHGLGLCSCKTARQKFLAAIAACPASILKNYDEMKMTRSPEAIEAFKEKQEQDRIAREANDRKANAGARARYGIDITPKKVETAH
jgi:hypothetical protein